MTFMTFLMSIPLQAAINTITLTVSSLSLMKYDKVMMKPNTRIHSHSFVEYLVNESFMKNSRNVNRNNWPSNGLIYALLSIITIRSSITSPNQKHSSPILFIRLPYVFSIQNSPLVIYWQFLIFSENDSSQNIELSLSALQSICAPIHSSQSQVPLLPQLLYDISQ